MGTPEKELLEKMKSLETAHAELRKEMSKFVIPAETHRCHRSSTTSPPPGYQYKERQCLNILESMGWSFHIFDSDGRIFYWKRSAENLYGYSPTEAIGKTIYELIISHRDVPSAKAIIRRCCMGETWTGKFPVTHKMGSKFTLYATNTPLYDDDDTFIGIICLSCDSRRFKDNEVSISNPVEEEMGREFGKPRSSVTTRVGLGPDQPLQTAIPYKIINLASEVRDKIRSKMKIGESNVFQYNESRDSRLSDAMLLERREDGNDSGAITPRGDPAGVFSLFALGKLTAHAQGDSIDDGERKPGIHKMMTSTAEAWISKKAMQWSGKGTGCESSNSQSGRFGWPWTQSEQDSNWAHSAVKSEIPTGDFNRPVANEASGSLSSLNANINSSSSSCKRGSSTATHKLDAETTSLDYEIMWEDLTFGEQIGQGSCGTVYHGLWYGSDVAIKVFSKQEYSDEVIISFRQEVSLMKRLRHPNILLFMGAGKPVPPVAKEYFQTRLETANSYGVRHSRYSSARGMNYLHNCNPPIVHRDLKSSNLLVDKNWSVKVADFGLSRVKHETYLATKTAKGTPQWMAPEVIQNARSNEKSDLYSFGVVLWELATQKIPWENLNAMQMIGAVGFMNRRLDIPEDVDPMWASMIKSCWHSEPQSRPTFHELLEKLKVMQKQYAILSQAARAASIDVPAKQVLSPCDL